MFGAFSYTNSSHLGRGALRPVLDHPLLQFDVLEKVVPLCDEPSAVVALSCVNHSLNKNVPECLSAETAFKICGSRLRVINTGAVEIPDFSPFKLIKGCHTLASLVEGDEGLTFLIMREGLTLNELVKIAADQGITVNIPWNEMLVCLGNIPIGRQAYGVLITNSVLKNSRNKSEEEREKLCFRVGCEMPTVHEYVALCVFTQLCFKKYLYGQNPLTYGHSSTHFGKTPLVVGGSAAPSRLCIPNSFFGHDVGAGGRRKL